MSLTDLAITELRPGFVAEISGVDIADSSAGELAAVVDAFHHHGSIVLHDQALTPAQFRIFASAFGELEGHTLQDFTLPGYPEIYVLSNRVENGRAIGAHNDGVSWHTDYAYKEEPVMCTMLYSIAVPDEEGDTLLADQCAAYDALSPERQDYLDTLRMQHSYEWLMTNRKYGQKDVDEAVLKENPDVIHPLIRTHPVTGRKALWVSGGTRGFAGMDQQESFALIDELVAYVTEDRFLYRHKWRKGDVLVWDNRCTLHRGTLFDDTRYIREMHRMWVKGDRPY